jgi:hypothetical protein
MPKGGVIMDKKRWTEPQISEIEVKMATNYYVAKPGSNTDQYSTEAGDPYP